MHTAICAFEDKGRAEQAIDSLVRAGFPRHDLHIQHRQLAGQGEDANDRWDALEREIAVDPGVVSAFGRFFARLFGRDHVKDHVDTYGRHVERGHYVVVVDADDEAQAERARTLLQGMQPGDLNLVPRPEQRPLRDIVGMRQEAGMVERNRAPSESTATADAVERERMERERAMASHVVSPKTGPDLRDPELERAPGLRYSDKDKPNG
jgi:hypothetical protein